MKKIRNPYDPGENKCFGCSTANPLGLKLQFTESEEAMHAEWVPSEFYQGYPNVLHGGIITALLDETSAWCVSVKKGTAGVTSEMRTRYLQPVYLNKGVISLRAVITKSDDRSATVVCTLSDSQSKVCAESEAEFFLYPEQVARRKFRYPGKEAFYEPDAG